MIVVVGAIGVRQRGEAAGDEDPVAAAATTSMSQISPVLMRGVLVRGLSGTRRVCPSDVAGGAVGLTVRVVGADASPWLSVTVSVIVREPAVA